MSEQLGGTIIVVAAPFAVVAAGIAIGAGAVLGAGYLVCKGCFQAASASKKAWHDHLDKLEAERKRRLEELRRQDQARMEALQQNYLKWIEEGSRTIEEIKETEARRQSDARAREIERQQAITRRLNDQKKLDMIEEEIAGLARTGGAPVFEKLKVQDRESYQRKLETAKSELERQIAKMRESFKAVDENVKIIEPAMSVEKKLAVGVAKTGDHGQNNTRYRDEARRLSRCKVQFSTFVFLPDEMLNEICDQAAEVENLIKADSASVQGLLKEKIDLLEKRVAQARGAESSLLNKRLGALNQYLALEERLGSLAHDPVLGRIVSDERRTRSKEIFESLKNPGEFYRGSDLIFERISKEINELESAVEDALEGHQTRINREVAKSIREVLSEIGYAATTVEEDRGRFVMVGTDSNTHPGAQTKIILDSSGAISIDVSKEGFKDQVDCKMEWGRLLQGLEARDIIIDINKKKETLSAVLNGIRNEGIRSEDITIEESGSSVRIQAVDRRTSHSNFDDDRERE